MARLLASALVFSLVLAGCVGGTDPQSAPAVSATVGTVNAGGDNATGTVGSIVGRVLDDEARPISNAMVALVALNVDS